MVKYGPSPRSPCVGREPVRGKKSPYAGGFRGSCIFHFSLFIYLRLEHGLKAYSFSSVIVGFFPQRAQESFFGNDILFHSIVRASKVRMAFVIGSPTPARYFTASVACIVPSIPAMLPRTPTIEQVSTSSFSGGSGKRQR